MGAGGSAVGGGLGWPDLETADDCSEDVQALLLALAEEVQIARKEADRRTGEDGKPYTREQFETKFGKSHKWDEAKTIDATNQQVWSIGEFLGSDLGDIVAQAITPPVAQKDPLLELAFARAVGQKGTVKAIKHLLEQQDVLTKIATKILESTAKLCANKVATGQAMHDKFAMEGAFEFFFGGKPDYFGGLEPRIGPPSARVLEAMVKDSERPSEWPKETINAEHPRIDGCSRTHAHWGVFLLAARLLLSEQRTHMCYGCLWC